MSEKRKIKRLYKPGPNIKQKLTSLKEAIVNRPPFCSGTVPLAASDLLLLYWKPSESDDTATGGFISRGLDVTKATEEELRLLVNACDQATFGMNHVDVLDLSYRTAWKLDPSHFATKLNIAHAGVMDSIRYNLFPTEQGNVTFFAELYKLNVYGKGSFFKPHKDTPRGEKMFGSLVVVLPTAHEGGALIIRHDGEEWKIESDTVAPPSITYAAFFGDVEHEVTEVESGFRLTLTYNLYFGESLDSQAIVSTASSTSPMLFTSLPSNANTFQTKLAELLADDTLLPMGGYLGFGLFHEYPFSSTPNLQQLTGVLKGNDAALMQACKAVGLTCLLRVCYEGKDEDDESNIVALCSNVPIIEGAFLHMELWQALKGKPGVSIVNADDDDTSADEKGYINLKTRNRVTSEDSWPPHPIGVFIHWVTKQTFHNAFKSHSIAYGNEPSLSYNYGRVCLLVFVGPPSRRSEMPQKSGVWQAKQL